MTVFEEQSILLNDYDKENEIKNKTEVNSINKDKLKENTEVLNLLEKVFGVNTFEDIISSKGEILDDIKNIAPNIVINDRLDTTEDFMKSLKKGCYKVINFEDLGKGCEYADAVINAMDEKQIYKNINFGGKVSFEDSFFQGATAELINFSDNFNSNEFRFKVKPKLEFPISTELINAEFLIDLINGKLTLSKPGGLATVKGQTKIQVYPGQTPLEEAQSTIRKAIAICE